MLEPRRSFVMVGLLTGVAGCTPSSTMVPLRAGPAARPEPIEITQPFELHRGFVIAVKGAIGELSDLTFILDTGTMPTLVDPRVATRLSLNGKAADLETFSGTQATEEVELPAVRSGALRIEKARALIYELAPLEGRFGVLPDAIIGIELLTGASFAIDYTTKTLRFGREGVWPSASLLDRHSPLPVVEVTIDGVRLRLAIDTGSEAISVFDSATPPEWRSRVEGEVGAADLAGDLRLQRITTTALALGAGRWQGVPVYLVGSASPSSSYDGVLGPRALGIARLQLDLERMEFGWSR